METQAHTTKKTTRRSFLRGLAKTVAVAAVAGAVVSLPLIMPQKEEGYHIYQVNRPIVGEDANSWEEVYHSIFKSPIGEVYAVTSEEYKFSENFFRLGRNEQMRQLNDPTLRELNFLNRNNPKIRDAVFLHIYLSQTRPKK